MQLDKTAIVISQRSGVELIDLSLIVVRRYWRSIALFASLGILPFAILDFILLWPLTQYDSLVMSSVQLGDPESYRLRYLWIISAVILIQAPLALSGVTYFIGQAVFTEQPTVRQVFLAVWRRAGALFFVLGVLRMSLVVFIPMTLLFRDPIFRPEIEISLYLVCLCGIVQLIRGFRPFAAEILLLERCPIYKIKGRPDQLAYAKRSSWLHSSLSFELFATHTGVAVVEFLTALSLSLSLIFLIGVLTGIWRWGPWMDLVFYPIIVWIVVTWGAVIRFLLYMNSRIRTEGWEIELRLKAESQRFQESLS
jgi:hypothetical protein